ncbi:hypothetical protein M3M33_17260, partial [Loigolactobacillus coryniformis]|uniref:hypothetical protein n=1 Tax=Loigolactobacillus coryniformis TaxID=1610 RepID=UPI00201ACA01
MATAVAPYNPGDYRNNYSWVGEIGKDIDEFTARAIGLYDINRQMKLNDNYLDDVEAQRQDLKGQV